MSNHFEENASTAHKDSANGTTFNLSDDSSSCYYLHPSDNPGALLVSEVFTGENYIAWGRSMAIALTVKNKIAFIDGSLTQPNTNNQSLHMSWLRSNNLVLSWLMNSITKENSQQPSLLHNNIWHLGRTTNKISKKWWTKGFQFRKIFEFHLTELKICHWIFQWIQGTMGWIYQLSPNPKLQMWSSWFMLMQHL